MNDFRCVEPGCNSGCLVATPCETGTWMVRCHNDHEVFPWPGSTLVAGPRECDEGTDRVRRAG